MELAGETGGKEKKEKTPKKLERPKNKKAGELEISEKSQKAGRGCREGHD